MFNDLIVSFVDIGGIVDNRSRFKISDHKSSITTEIPWYSLN